MPEMNPAALSKELASLLPRGAIAAELFTSVDPTFLMPEEARHLGRAVPKRVQEYTAGRLCARRALAELGIVGFALQVAGDRRPLWPPNIVGSITHTKGYCAAAVASIAHIRSLGIDCEPTGSVKPALWHRICTPRELGLIESLAQELRGRAATLVFCAKEAFYKCQYALVGEPLGFQDAEIEWDDGLAGVSGTLKVRATRDIALTKHTAVLKGGFREHQGFLTTALSVPADQ